ncbi:MAG: hypothetical protein LBB66_07325 [Desulfovibrio sp.]|jgi:hypothetical protein|nr:hypothetical protein [Desulfovibrio sp.]
MKRLLIVCCIVLNLATTVSAGEKIDPADFICAELVALPTTTGEPSLFEALQIDGYVSAALGSPVADPQIMAPLLEQVYVACQAEPAEKVLTFWKKGRETFAFATDSPWQADKTTCGDYAANEDDGSGFLIWLDGYNRRKNSLSASVLESDDTVNAFLDKCRQRPQALMLDVMKESVKK